MSIMDFIAIVGLCVAFFSVGYNMGKDINTKK